MKILLEILVHQLHIFLFNQFILVYFKYSNILVKFNFSYLLKIFFFSFKKVRYYIKLNKIDEAERCVKEISSLSPLCHQMFYMRGLINDARGQLKLAKQNYNDALAINPYHFPTLIQLTKLLIQIGNYSLAEKYARDAISIQPSNYQPW